MKIGKRLREILEILQESGLIEHSVFVSGRIGPRAY